MIFSFQHLAPDPDGDRGQYADSFPLPTKFCQAEAPSAAYAVAAVDHEP